MREVRPIVESTWEPRCGLLALIYRLKPCEGNSQEALSSLRSIILNVDHQKLLKFKFLSIFLKVKNLKSIFWPIFDHKNVEKCGKMLKIRILGFLDARNPKNHSKWPKNQLKPIFWSILGQNLWFTKNSIKKMWLSGRTHFPEAISQWSISLSWVTKNRN